MSVRTLARQLSHFLGGNIIGLLLSLVSFPILTRLLDQSHYGILVLVNTTMSLAVAVAKGGTSEAIVRFYGDYAGSPAQLRVFTSTVLVTRGIQAVVAVAVYLIALYLVFLFAGLEPVALTAFLIMAPYVAIRPLGIVPLNYFRATGLSVRYNVVSIVDKAATVVLSILALLLISNSLNSYFGAMLVAETLVTVALLWWLFSNYEFSPRAMSWELGRTLLAFGLPLAATEIGYLLLAYADRYLLAALSSSEELAVYSVGYNLPSYVNDAVVFSLSYAIIPLYTDIFRQRGTEAVTEFLNKTLHYYIGGMLLACAGYAAVAHDLIRWLASDKYAGSASFSPIVLFSLMLMGSNYITYAGLYLHKKSRVILAIMIASVMVNVIANFALIPRFGATGAAYATLLACVASAGATIVVARRLVSFSVRLPDVVYYGVGAAVLYLVMSRIDLDRPFATLLVKLAVGAVVVAAILLVRERELRTEVRRRLRSPPQDRS